MTTRSDKRPVSRKNREAEKRRNIMKKTIVSLLLVLSLFLSAFALASCGKRSEAADETTADNGATNPASDGGAGETDEATAAATTDKWETLAKKITMIAARDRQLKFEFSSNHSAEKTSKNDIYLKGPDAIEVDVTPLIQQMVYERNRTANELLGTTIDYVFWDYAWGSQAEQIDLVVKGNASDAPDLFVNMLNDLSHEMMNGAFKDIRSIPGSFFDFTTAGWLTEWMENMSFTGDRAYLLGSDYFIDILRAMSVMPFNKTMMDQNAVKLAGAILPEGETLGENEELSTYFFDFVDKGNWTWDALGKLSAAIWEDTDGDGTDSIRDRLGFLGAAGTNMASSMYLYSNSEKLFEERENTDRNDPNYGKPWIYYADMGGLGDIFDAVEGLFSGQGTFGPDGSKEGNTASDPGIAYHFIKFGQGEVLFAGACVLGALEDDAFQQMADLYSVVPVPKIHADGEYNTVIHNVGDAGAINVQTTPGKAKAVSAYLQYCTENSGSIRREFLEIVTKYKTTVYNQGTDRMLDLIYNHTINGRDKAIEDIMGTDSTCKPLRWHVLLKTDNQFTHDSSYLAAQYASAVSAKQAYLNEKLATWYTLPKVEPNAE